jgi:hypothetical protein
MPTSIEQTSSQPLGGLLHPSCMHNPLLPKVLANGLCEHIENSRAASKRQRASKANRIETVNTVLTGRTSTVRTGSQVAEQISSQPSGGSQHPSCTNNPLLPKVLTNGLCKHIKKQQGSACQPASEANSTETVNCGWAVELVLHAVGSRVLLYSLKPQVLARILSRGQNV